VKVLCTTPIIDDLVSRIGGERIDHLPLMDRTMDPHSYELVKGDDEKFLVAQVLFYNGLGLEHSASLKTQLQEHPHAIALGEEIRRQDASLILQHRGQTDPHIWLDVSLWEKTVDPIVVHLTKIDPEGKEYYEVRGVRVKKELLDLDQWMFSKLQSIGAEKRFLVTSHDAFNYFTRRYLHESASWQDRFCAPEGLAPDGQLGFQDLQRVIDHLQKNRIQTVFSESNVSLDSLKKIVDICREKEIHVEIASSPLFSDTLSGAGTHFTYEEMMKHNATVLYEAWSETRSTQ
jgi:manganese/zinc/iron transport system substrate-binding protein